MSFSSEVLIYLALQLHRIRFGSNDEAFYRLVRFGGYVDALWDSRLISLEVKRRLDALAENAFHQLGGRVVRS